MEECAGMLPDFSERPLSLPGFSAEREALRDEREGHPRSSAGAQELEAPASAQQDKLIGQEPQVRNSQCSISRFWGLAIWMILLERFQRLKGIY